MISDLLKYIANSLHGSNPYFQQFTVNCLKDIKGRIIHDFSRGYSEMFNVSINDIYPVGCYIRSNGIIDYNYPVKRFGSCTNTIGVIIPQRLIAYSIGRDLFDLYKIESKLRNDLMSLAFNAYTGKETDIIIKLKQSDIDSANVLKTENNLTKFGQDLSVIAIDFEINFSALACESNTCDVFVT